MRYLVSYDLVGPEKDYPELIKALKALGAVKVLLSEWALTHANTTPLQLAKYFWQHMDGNDRLMVTEMPDSYAKANLLADPPA